MFLQVVIAIVLGVLAGTFTGLIPGVHINLVAIVLLTVSPVLLVYTSSIVIVCFIISMAITHTFLDSIPSIYLGAPDADTVMAVLPGHKLLLEGKGHEAVKLTTLGSLLCLLLGLALMPVFIWTFPRIYTLLLGKIGWILLGIVIWLLLRSKGKNQKFWSIFVFATAGILGIIVLNSKIISQPLLPMLSGLFGTSTLLLSLFQNVEIPPQRITDQLVTRNSDTAKALTAGTLSGALVALFPGLGSAQAAVLSTAFFPEVATLGYLILVGGINTVNFLVSLATVYTLSKARNGAMIAALSIIDTVSLNSLLLYLCVCLLAGGVATIFTLKISKYYSSALSKINYRMICASVILFVTTLVIVFSGMLGFIVLIISTAIGLVPPLTNTSRSHAMGCLLVPVIIYFLL